MFANTINQKMIIASSKSSSEAEQILRSAKRIIDTHNQFSQLDIKIEKLDIYFLVTMSPIDSIPLKHALFSVLQTTFPGIFTIENIALAEEMKKGIKNTVAKTKVEPKVPTIIVKPKVSIDKTIPHARHEKKSFLANINNEWYALFALALAGFMLIMRSNSQIGKIKKLQTEIEEIQKKNDK